MFRTLMTATTILVVLLPILLVSAPTANAYERPKGPCTGDRFRVTRDMSAAERRRVGRRTVRCAFRRFAPEHLEQAKEIARRESGFDPRAWNRTTDCRGLFQHLGKYWPARVVTYLRERWFPNTWPRVSAFNARANAIVAAKMVRGSGWHAWS